VPAVSLEVLSESVKHISTTRVLEKADHPGKVNARIGEGTDKYNRMTPAQIPALPISAPQNRKT
jgi:hypothetical protein